MRWLWLTIVLFAVSCAGPLASLRVITPVQVGSQQFTLRSHQKSAEDAARIQRALAKATPALSRWGGLREPVTLYLLPSHEALEEAVHRPGFVWLRAWGRYDEVFFQAPSTWTSRDELVDQLVLHELTHCLLFQRTSSRETWLTKRIPLWFREGMAISTAGQASLYPTLEDSALWLLRNRTLDAFRDGESLSEGQSVEVYGLALHAFTFLERRYGTRRIEQLMDTLRDSAGFPEAFAQVMGVPVERFQKDFENYLRLRAFRGSARGRRLSAPPAAEP